MTSINVVRGDTTTSDHAPEALSSDSHTAHRLKHATPEHLNRTTSRFFIGPIPEGWLSSNRKSWYKRRFELSTYSSRKGSFTAADNKLHHRTLTGLDGPSTTAQVGFSFPQPRDVNEESEHDGASSTDTEADDSDIEARILEPLPTNIPQIVGIADEEDDSRPKLLRVPSDTIVSSNTLNPDTAKRKIPQRSRTEESFYSAKERIDTGLSKYGTPKGQTSENLTRANTSGLSEDGASPSDISQKADPPEASARTSNVTGSDMRVDAPSSSTTALLPPPPPDRHPSKLSLGPSQMSMQHHEAVPLADDADMMAERQRSRLARTATGVRFKVAENVGARAQGAKNRISSVRRRIPTKRLHRGRLKEGVIVKMEKMLVRVDMTMQAVDADFDENNTMSTEGRTLEKWREYMVVVRQSHHRDADFKLQFYQTRVIPEIEGQQTKTRPKHEIELNPTTTKVNLFSSLDKTVCVWHPYRKGTRVFIMRPRSTAHSVEWYTFIRESLGWERPAALQVNVPDLSVTLHLKKPFEGLENAVNAALESGEPAGMERTMAEEKAVSAKIVKICLKMLEGSPEWTSVLEMWTKSEKMGLAWKRYDRLEWVHGVNEQRMYGAMAMQRSYELELRPKQHYPTNCYGKKGKYRDEPMPIEGFLIRLTSQKGIHQRMGKTFIKRLYFTTQNQYLMFSRPAKATPPHPPRLPTISGSNIPSAQDILEKTPSTFEVEPYPLQGGQIEWLSSQSADSISRDDSVAAEESARNLRNLTDSDGFINMTRIQKVRKFTWGSAPVDDELDSGSDANFHESVTDTHPNAPDGTTGHVDIDRTFELLLNNGLVIRLQAYSEETRDIWITRLRKLVKYWKLRTLNDMDLLKSVRKANLQNLQIDEGLEAVIGQFARKWEVSKSEASPSLYNICPIAGCRAISMAGLLYRKPRRHATFTRCHVILADGKLLIFQASVRKRTGGEIKHIHQEREGEIDLKDSYVYSGLITEDDLLYQNQTFDSSRPGSHALPRVFREDGWTSTDEDAMTCFVVWLPQRRSYYRAVVGRKDDGSYMEKLKQVTKLGVPGRSIVFKCRSRAERDHWVLNIGIEIEKSLGDEDVRVEG